MCEGKRDRYCGDLIMGEGGISRLCFVLFLIELQ